MKKSVFLCSVVLALAAPVGAAPGDLKLTIGGGRVTLVADNVPVRTILQEWARLGQSKIINGEKVLGAPVTLRLLNVPEEEALDVVLRSASGYLAAPREAQLANASRFDRIVILATSRPTTSAAAPPAAVSPMHQTPQQNFPQQQPFPSNPAVSAPVMDDQQEDSPEDPNPQNAPPQEQPPVTAPRPGPIQVSPGAPSGMQPPLTRPTQLPVTSPRPGAIQPQPETPPQPPARPIP